ncbi:MAG TPA: sigma-70 family RNA polymerase sigma factor [Spirochaetota bacterium]|nr:sigma-70 family RNA polymerase sigma factor [Spirochaetota bacterium]
MKRSVSTNERDDETLVRETLAGDRRAFDLLVLRHGDMLFNLCFRMLGEYDEASDCAQDAFFRAYRGLAGFRGEAAFSTWLYRIAVNTCKNRLASAGYRRSRKMVRLEGTGADDALLHSNGRVSFANPAARYERDEREALIQHALDALPPDEKTVAVLCDIEGKSYEEIVATTGMPLGTVKSRVARARRRLRSKLEGIV